MITRGGKPAYHTLSEEESKAEGQCVKEDHDGATFMEFVTEDDRAHGFPCSQLMGYTLERVPESEFKGEAPEDRLHLFFSTHDVTLTGWRLRPLVNMVRARHARQRPLPRHALFSGQYKIALHRPHQNHPGQRGMTTHAHYSNMPLNGLSFCLRFGTRQAAPTRGAKIGVLSEAVLWAAPQRKIREPVGLIDTGCESDRGFACCSKPLFQSRRVHNLRF